MRCDGMERSGAAEISVPCQCQKDILNTKLKVRATGPYCIATSTFTTQTNQKYDMRKLFQYISQRFVHMKRY